MFLLHRHPLNDVCYRNRFSNGTHTTARSKPKHSCMLYGCWIDSRWWWIKRAFKIKYISIYECVYRYFAICKLHTVHIFVDGWWWEIEILCKAVWKCDAARRRLIEKSNKKALLIYWIFVIFPVRVPMCTRWNFHSTVLLQYIPLSARWNLNESKYRTRRLNEGKIEWKHLERRRTKKAKKIDVKLFLRIIMRYRFDSGSRILVPFPSFIGIFLSTRT